MAPNAPACSPSPSSVAPDIWWTGGDTRVGSAQDLQNLEEDRFASWIRRGDSAHGHGVLHKPGRQPVRPIVGIGHAGRIDGVGVDARAVTDLHCLPNGAR